jgi:superfamily I DNA and/or RNA helicase
LISSIENEIFKYQKNKNEQKGKNNILENNEKEKKETKVKIEKKEGESKSNFNDINTSNNKENNKDKEKDENDKKMDILKNYKFAIICAYKSQVLKFREMKKADKFFNNNQILNEIEINTVDSFQGQERDIIIFSTVRANFKDDSVSSNLEDGEIPKTPEEKLNENNNNNIGIGFLNDFRRMNVGLSRAKVGCFVVGHFETLKNNSYWKKLINFCKEKNSFFKVEKSKESDSTRNILI